MRKEFKVILLTMFIMFGFAGISESFAEGGKNQMKNPVFNEDGSMIGVVVPLRCELLVNMDDGSVGWFCEDTEETDD